MTRLRGPRIALSCRGSRPVTDASCASPVMESRMPSPTFNALRSMGAINPVRRALRNADLPTARSWSDLEAKLREVWSDEVDGALAEVLGELRLHGRKHIFLHDLNDETRGALLACAPSADQRYASVFPIEPAIPKDEAPKLPVLAKIIDEPGRRLFIMTSSREVRREEELEARFLAEDAPEEIRHADEITYVVKMREFAVDVVVVPREHGLLEVRVDLFHHATDPSQTDTHGALIHMVHGFARDTGLATPEIGIRDLKSAITSMYNDDTEGRVVELAFTCPTDARRREVLHAKGAADLRTESFHAAGVLAINGNIDIYRIAVDWNTDAAGELLHDARLLLPGTLGLLRPASVLNEARIPRLVGRLEYEHMLARLLEHA